MKPTVDERDPLLPNKRNGASFTGAVFNLSTNIVGAGIVALPATMKLLGLGPGILMIAFMAFLTETSIEMLLRFSRVGNSVSYGGLMGVAFGRPGRMLLQICVAIKTLGILVVYMIIIGITSTQLTSCFSHFLILVWSGDVLSGTSSTGVHHAGILEGWFGVHWWTGRFFVLLVTALAIFAPLACFKRIDSLRYTSALSVTLAVVFVVITAGITIVKIINGSIAMPRWLPVVIDMTSFFKLFTAVPVVVTAYICHYNVHTIDNELEDSSKMRSIVQTALGLCSTVYIATSFFGFLLFGDSTLDDVLANFDSNLGIPYSSLLNDAVRVSYAVHLMLVFPIIFFALRINLDGLLFPSSRSLVSDNRRFALISIGLIVVVFLGANFIPSIWDVFQFTGATAAVCIGFIFPAAITLRDPHGIATKKDKIISIFMIALAVFSNLVAIYSDINALFKKTASRNA